MSRRGPLVLPVVAGLLLAGVCAVCGMDPWRAGTAGAVVATVAWLIGTAPRPSPSPRPAPAASVAPGVRTDLLDLAAGVQVDRGAVDPAALRRVQAAGGRRLRRLGLHLDRAGDLPAVERLVGPAALEVLRAQPDQLPLHGAGGRPPTLAAVLACVDRLEALDRPGSAPEDPSGRGTARGGSAGTPGDQPDRRHE